MFFSNKFFLTAAVCCAFSVYLSNSAPLQNIIYLCLDPSTPKVLLSKANILEPPVGDKNFTFDLSFSVGNETNVTCLNISTIFGEIQLISQSPNLSQVEFVIVPDAEKGVNILVDIYGDEDTTMESDVDDYF